MGPLSVVGLSLGFGSLSCDGRLTFVASLLKKPESHSNLSTSTCATKESSHSSSNKSPRSFLRYSSSFLRVADLKMHKEHCEEDALSDVETASSSSFSVANYSYAAVDPPPGIEHDPLERWVALDDGTGSHAPVAPFAVEALAQAGFNSVVDETMWSPHAPSKLKSIPWHKCTWPSHGTIHSTDLPLPGSPKEDSVILWTGKFNHGLYGSELPVVRAAGILPVAPRELFDLLVDSDRVKEYNKLSLGRQDLLVLQNNMEEEGPFGKSITKVMRGTSQPPLVRLTMEFVSIFHAKELEDKSGYLLVTRAVTHPESDSDHHHKSATTSANVLRSEILMGVNLIRRIEGDEHRSLMINVCQIRSPMVPMMIANRIGASAAANFIKDLRMAVA